MPTRREFLQQAAIISSAATWPGGFPAAIAKAMAIDPEPHSTFLDAEHVVILMQENRSFDHAFGTLQGVRGFNDPRAISLPNGNPVWVQTNPKGESYVPFRLNIKDTNATWAGCLPHGRTDQVDARNGGRYDRWLAAKRSGEKQYADMPLTLGYYTRQDIPFYYALADAFTICDQHFCSALTCTTPNRLYLWTGTIRDKPTGDSLARLWNEDAIYEAEASWKTFPERLEDHGITWKVYQNELTVPSGLEGEHDSWLANYGDNPLEYFTQYQVRFSPPHLRHLEQQSQKLTDEIKSLRSQVEINSEQTDKSSALKKRLDEKAAALHRIDQERRRWTAENFEKLSPRAKALHSKAFSTNATDPDYRKLATHTYHEGGNKRVVKVPKSDILGSFREDVRNGQLPAVSWLVAPERFSDHPSSPWYGAWYIAEVIDILTNNPEVWKKTVFILTYDENDGYFDHLPPFVAPSPRRPRSGRASAGIDTGVEYVERDQELKHRLAHHVRESPIGLGYRVPMIIASPWSRGGCVCSQVFDHTSVLQFLERLLSSKTGRKVDEPNISQWRRTVCGDLTSAFQAYDGPASGLPAVVERNAFIEQIHRAQFREKPSGFKKLTQSEIDQIRSSVASSPHMPRQEPGVRRSCPLPYEIVVNGSLNAERTGFRIRFEARNQQFGERAAGSPFIVYARTSISKIEVRNYAVAAGADLEDTWNLADFESGVYDLRVYGPNGFYREFTGSADDPSVTIAVRYDRSTSSTGGLTGKVEIEVSNQDADHTHSVDIHQGRAYGGDHIHRSVAPATTTVLLIDTEHNFNWYDFNVQVVGAKLFRRCSAGRVETGEWSYSDPAMGEHRKRV